MAVDVLKSTIPAVECESLPGVTTKFTPNVPENRYGTYGFGPQDQKKYFLRKANSADENSLEKRRQTEMLQRKSAGGAEKEKHWVIIPDLVRSYTIPSQRDPSGRSIILRQNDFERIKTSARVLTRGEQQTMLKSALEDQQRELEASRRRKELFLAIDKEKGRAPKKFTEVDLEIKVQKDSMLKRAQDARLGQEDEMKDLSQRITGIKNAAIHIKQIESHQRLQQTLHNEERRLENMMEDERLASIEREKERERKVNELGKKFGNLLQKQIKDNQQLRLLDDEVQQEEHRRLIQGIANAIDTFDEEYRMKRQKQKIMKQGLDDCVKGLMHRILEDKWQDKMREKLAETHVTEDEQRAKEREEQKMRDVNQRHQTVQKNLMNFEKMMAASVDWYDIRLKRDLESNERKWRQKEKEEQLEKVKKTESLKRLRDENLALKQKITAVYMEEAKDDYQEMIKFQKESIIKEREMEKQARDQRYALAHSQLQQIKESESKRIRERAQMFADGVNTLTEKEKILRQMSEMKKKKLTELREQCPDVPEHYIRFVERKVKITPIPAMKFAQKFSKYDR